MKYKIIDGMKKEGKLFRNIMIISIALFLLTFVYMYVNNKGLQEIEVLSMFLGSLMFAILGLYCWLYSMTYKVYIDEKQILLKTLFRKVKIDICNIERYSYKKYKKSKFYQFNLAVKGNKILVNTRYKEDFENILIVNKIEQIIKG